MMEAVKISPKYQVVIPKRIREALHLCPGQTLQVMELGNRIELVPERAIQEMEGFLEGIDTEVPREDERL
jgi:AbrB family looped-hinge helix DNA binding protein